MRLEVSAAPTGGRSPADIAVTDQIDAELSALREQLHEASNATRKAATRFQPKGTGPRYARTALHIDGAWRALGYALDALNE